MKGWETRQLGEVCEMINRGIAPKYVDEGGVCVINQKCIRNHVINFELARRHDIAVKSVNPERYIQVGDVLVNSTGTGTLGRVAQVRKEPTEITTVDTHVTIVRPHSGRFFNDFFGYMLVRIEDEISSSGEGASGQTELAKSTIAERFKVSFPNSISEQKQIVSIVDEAFEAIDIAIDNTKQNLTNARELFDSYLNAIFTQKGNGWEEKTLQQVSIKFSRGKSKHRPRGDDKLYGGKYPLIQTGDISNSKHRITTYSQTYNELGLAQSELWRKGTICIAIVGANVAETSILDFDACFPDSVIGIVVNNELADNDYIEYLLQSFKAELKEKGKGTARDNINLGTFADQRFPFPDVKTQKIIACRLEKLSFEIERLEAIYQQKLTALNELKQSILHKAFTGELTADKADLMTNIEQEAISA